MPIKPKLPQNRTPWPLKWVALAILVCIVPYTWLTLAYRKSGKAYEPYEDSKTHANNARLLAAGYQRVEVRAERPADPQRWRDAIDATAQIADAPAGLPLALAATLVEPPLLPKAIVTVAAPHEARTLLPYQVFFTCVLPDSKKQLSGAQLYLDAQSVVIVPVFESIPSDLVTRSTGNSVVLTVPAGVLQPGPHTVSLVGTESSKQWTIEAQ